MLKEILEANAERSRKFVDLSPLEGKTVLVTGGSGLLGINILALLRGKCDALYAPLHKSNPLVRWDNVMYRRPSRRFIDYIIHAAGYSAPGKFIEQFESTVNVNTYQILDLRNMLGRMGRMLYLSSSEIYTGANLIARSQLYETDIGHTEPNHPRGVYIESKRCGEAICHAINNAEPGHMKIARVYSSYGPGVNRGDERVMSQFMTQIIRNGQIELKDQGKATRRWNYVGDAVPMLMNILLYGKQDLYNVSTNQGKVLSIADLANDLTIMKKGAPVIFGKGDSALAAPASIDLSIDRYIKEFGDPPHVGMGMGLKQTLLWHEELEN